MVVVGEEARRGLSTERAFGAAAGNVEGLRWRTVSPGGAQNGFVGVRGSYGRGESGNRAAVCSNCSGEEQWLWRLGFVAFPVGLRARKKKGASRGGCGLNRARWSI